MADQAVQKVILRMVDAAGKIGTTSVNITTVGGTDPITACAELITALNAASNAKVVSAVGQTASNEAVGLALSNPYNVRDKLAVEYIGSQNDHHITVIGDLNPAILDVTNMETVDPTDSDWLDLKTAFTSNVVDKLGNAVTVIRGFRQMSRNLKTTLKFQ